MRKNNKVMEVCSHAWKTKDDIELMRLILKCGYSRWRLICENFYADNSIVMFKGYDYLVAVLWPSVAKTPDYKQTIEKIIQIRAGMILNHKAF